MQRNLSLSRFGNCLDQNLYLSTQRTDQNKLQNVLKSKSSTHFNNYKNHQKNVTSRKSLLQSNIKRDTLSSFQKCHTKVQNINAIYNLKIQITKKHHPHFSMRKQNPPSYFQTISNFHQAQNQKNDSNPCQKFKKSQVLIKPSKLSLSNTDLAYKPSSLIGFSQQTQRPFYRKLRKLQQQENCKSLPADQTPKKEQRIKKQRMKKTHAFQSYSQHDLLNPQKVAKFSSQMNAHNVNLKRYKQKNNDRNLRFDKFVNQIKTRYDRDCLPWIVKLSYDTKDDAIRSSKASVNFQKQIDRKLNEVHSKYPIRIAM